MICEILWRGFRISNAERVKDFSVLTESKDLMTPFYVGARESLQNKRKGRELVTMKEYTYTVSWNREILAKFKWQLNTMWARVHYTA